MTCDEKNDGAIQAIADALCLAEHEWFKDHNTISYTRLAIVALQAYKTWEASKA